MTGMTGQPHVITFDKNSNMSMLADNACGSNIIVRQPTATHGRLGLFFVCQTNTFVFASDVTPVTQPTSDKNNDNIAVSTGNCRAVFWTAIVALILIVMTGV